MYIPRTLDIATNVSIDAFTMGAMSTLCSALFIILSCALVIAKPVQRIDTRQITSNSNVPNNPQYSKWASSALASLQHFYNSSSGLYETTGWWNSASIVTMLADYSLVIAASRSSNIAILQNTLANAAQNQPQMVRIASPLTSTNTFTSPNIPGGLTVPESTPQRGYLDDSYDDEGWWALAWLKAYDLTGDARYVYTAMNIFDDMTQGYPAKCGGIWWDKNQTASVAITNELFFTIAAQLANRVANRNYYLQWALTQWKWFERSGLINAQGTINDGLDLSTCQDNGGYTWSHNQGVIIGGLLELYQANANSTYISIAQNVAKAGIAALADQSGILHEKCEPNCGNDAPQYKGIFVRNLQYLQQGYPDDDRKSFIQTNANSLWTKSQETNQSLGLVWSGPPGHISAATQGSALDALVAAVAAG